MAATGNETAASDEAPVVAEWEWKTPFLIGLVCGLALGAVVGARYLNWWPGLQVPLTLLPPYSRNFTKSPAERLTLGMSKQEVIHALGVEQVVVLPGDILEAKLRNLLHHHTDVVSTKYPFDQVAEIWLIPERTAGLSNFTSLFFDGSQRLCLMGGGEWMFGFPVNPYHYDR
ncbi:MAG: hypothetical protein NTW86_09300 [Candidatus Sumerlaeota bacterium]|nr:hypothetical protein [Candidatus Sumerlaeota bacterium]